MLNLDQIWRFVIVPQFRIVYYERPQGRSRIMGARSSLKPLAGGYPHIPTLIRF